MAASIQRPDGSIVYFDVTTAESLGGSSDITDFPVEDNPNISDHIQPKPASFSIQCFITNEPLEDKGGQRGMTTTTVTLPTFQQVNGLAPNIGALTRTVENAVASLFQTPGPTEYNVPVLSFTLFDAVRDMLSTLEVMRLGRELLSVTTSKKSYDNCALERWDVSRSAGTGTGAEVTISFKQINTVAVEVGIAPLPTEPRGKPAKPKGAKNPTPADDATKKSVAKVVGPAVVNVVGNAVKGFIGVP